MKSEGDFDYFDKPEESDAEDIVSQDAASDAEDIELEASIEEGISKAESEDVESEEDSADDFDLSFEEVKSGEKKRRRY